MLCGGTVAQPLSTVVFSSAATAPCFWKHSRFETLVSISFSAAKETLRTKYLTLKLFTIGGDKATPQMLQESDSTIVSTTTRYNNYVMIQPYNSAMVQGII